MDIGIALRIHYPEMSERALRMIGQQRSKPIGFGKRGIEVTFGDASLWAWGSIRK
jgi:hypothetical protein